MLVLCRVDDRLIHGQVVIGWGASLGLEHIVLVDDHVRQSAWEQEIYRMAVPEGVGVEFASVEEAAAGLPRWARDPRRIILLTGSIAAMAAMLDRNHGLVHQVNLGGVHAGPGRRQRLRYVYLTEEEASTLGRLHGEGVAVTAQDLPTSTAVPVGALL